MLADILHDPIVLDLDGDGIELTALGSSNTYFDFDHDGTAERTGWVSPHDGLLVHDANHNGTVDGIDELFGSATVDGYDELATIDSNGDGKIDANDAAFADLLVWRDLNSDGEATADELQTLAQSGISRLNLGYTQVDDEVAGNVIARTGSYVRTDGTSRTMGSVQFALDETTGRPVIPDGAALGNLRSLPNLTAFAANPDLRTAMYFDPVLKAMVEDLVFDEHGFDTFIDFSGGGTKMIGAASTFEGKFLDVLYRWLGVDTTVPSDPDYPYSWQVYEALTGRVIEPNNQEDVRQLAALWPQLVGQLGVAFLIQSADNPRLAPLLELADAAAALDPDESNYLDRLSTLTQAAVAASQAVEPVYDYLELFQDLRVDSLTGAILGDFDGFVARVLEDQPSFLMAGTFTGGGGPTLAVSGVDDRHPWTAWYQDQGALLFSVGQAMGYDDAYVLNVTGWRWLNSDMTDLHGTAGADLIDQAITFYQKFMGFAGPGAPDGILAAPTQTHDQRMFGYAGNDELRGNDGVDSLVGGTGNDLLKGGSGSDMYIYALGDELDRIVDDSGTDDTIYFSAEYDAAELRVARVAGTNDLQLHFGNLAEGIVLANQWSASAAAVEHVQFVGEEGLDSGDIASLYLATLATAGADTIAGSWASERIIGLDGNDVLSGLAGNDELSGGAGADSLSGGDGDDYRLDGGDGNDTINGNNGNDTLIGGAGNDILTGWAGNDTYVFALGDGQDIVRDYWDVFSAGADAVVFGSGILPADLIVTEVGGGADLLLSIAGTTDSLLLDNTLINSDYRIEQVRFADGTILSHAQLVALATIPTGGNDVFYGSYDSETLEGGGGNDTLTADEGNDVLIGGTGNDLLIGWAGNDTYVFGLGDGQDIVRDYWDVFSAGSDTILFAAGVLPSDIIVTQVAAGTDLLITIAGTTDSILLDNSINDADHRIERAQFADGTVLTHAQLMTLATTPTGGNDVFYGSYDWETLDGGAGNDTLNARSGNDTLIGGAGNDILTGWAGNDTYVFNLGDGQDIVRDYWDIFSAGSDTILFGGGILAGDIVVTQDGGGSDLLLTVAGTADSILLDNTITSTDYRIEQVRFADGTILSHATLMTLAMSARPGSDTYWGDTAANVIAAGDGDDTILGRAGNDTLSGDGGNDIVNGEDGLDLLYGGDGNDTLSGGAGNDTLTGGAGVDVLTGGAGADIFAFGEGTTGIGANADRITDFASGLDKLDLSAVDADAAIAGDQAFAFIGTGAFSGVAGQLRYSVIGSERWLQMDKDGDGNADLEIVLTGAVTPLAADFVL